eukprot:TRINITY_DN4122_c0_g1_i4.p1 TRINITY_DN4122_c0_g1~~TRINITY_DN4122_c0_g1_i4.p1  ORF type:complete len:945 (+),score=286.26 TRINITY_DN4122_c0_g1_i4:179-3013(+)
MSSNGLSANSSPRGLVKSRSEEALHEHLLSNKSPSDTTLALQWINKKLAPFGMEVKGVLDLMDGKVIVKLLEIATGKQVLTVAMRKRMESSSYGSIYQRECVSYALNFMVENNMISKNQQIGPEEIVSGNSKMILAVIWAIIRFSESPSHEAKTTQATWHAIPSVSEKEKEPSSPKSDESVSPASLKRSEPIDVHGVATPESSESVVESPPAEESASGTLRRKKKHRSHKEKREKKDKKEKHGKKEKKEKKEKSERKEKKEKKEKRERDSTNSPSPTIEIKSSKRRLKRSGSFSSVSSDDTTASMVSGTSSKESTMSSPRSSRHADTADKSPVSDRKEQRGSGELLRRPTSRDVTAKMGQKLGTARSRSYTTDTAKKSTEKKGGTLRMFGRSKNSKDNANSDDEAKSPEKNNEGTESDFRLSGNSKLSSNSGDSISFQRISKQRSGSIYDGVSPLENMNSRDWAAREIYTSELQYLKHLDNLVLNYLPKMKDICSADEIKIIFSNVVVLKNFSNKLLQELEQRIANWTQTQTVGDIFLKFYPFFKAYNQYCNNYDSALACYTECMKRPDFVNLCNAELARTKDGLGPDLQSLLITPVQRIPRYSLLLKELLKLTTPSHPDYENVSKALEKIKEVTDLINWNVIQTDTAKVYDTIVQNVRGIMPYMMVHRKFIMEGLFNIALGTKQPGRFLPQWLLLFTDMIFLVSGTTGNVGIGERKVERAFTTTAVWQKDLSETNGDNYFSLLTPEDTLIIQAKDIDDKRKWMDAINQMLARAFKTETIGDVRNLEYKFSSGDVYKGDWLVAKMHGHGRFALASGKIYEGQFVDGVMEGQGTMDYGKKMIYTGEWRAGVPHGKGLFSQGEIMFYGVWKSGVKKKGEIKWANGDVYNGKFRNDRMHGAGVLKCGNGDKYDGEWKNNKRHGTGNFTSVLGYYDGNYFRFTANFFR